MVPLPCVSHVAERKVGGLKIATWMGERMNDRCSWTSYDTGGYTVGTAEDGRR